MKPILHNMFLSAVPRLQIICNHTSHVNSVGILVRRPYYLEFLNCQLFFQHLTAETSKTVNSKIFVLQHQALHVQNIGC